MAAKVEQAIGAGARGTGRGPTSARMPTRLHIEVASGGAHARADATRARRLTHRMRLYNTLTRQEEDFAPRPAPPVRMYTCGLTVYNRGHIGNFRTFVCLDVLRRTLEHVCGWPVRQVMNFTDVDDRTIAGAEKAGQELRAYTDQYIAAFREDAAALGLEPVEENPRATDEANLRGDGRPGEGARAQRPHVSQRRLDLLPHRLVLEVRRAGAAGPGRHQARRARRLGQLQQGRCAGFRAVEGDASRTSRRGTTGSGPAVRAGTSSARRWPCACSASRRSTSTPAAST